MEDRLEKHQLQQEPQQDFVKDEELGQSRSQHIEDISPSGKPGAAGNPTFGARVKNHFRRFWWVHVIVVIVVTLCVVLPLVYTGFHNIAQHDVNKSRLFITSMAYTDPTPSSVHLAQVGYIENNSSYHPRLSAFNASLFLEDTEPNIQPFAYISMPAIHATRVAATTVNQTVPMANPAQFGDYCAAVMASEEMRFAVRGKTKLKEMSFPKTTVNYNQVVTIKGLNSLQGFNVTSFTILQKPAFDGANLIGEVSIPNPSIITLELGNITQNLYFTNTTTLIGTSVIPSLTLRPGPNTAPFRATTNQTLVIAAIESTYKDGIVPVDLVGSSVVNKNGEHLSYYEGPLSRARLGVRLNVLAALFG